MSHRLLFTLALALSLPALGAPAATLRVASGFDPQTMAETDDTSRVQE
jgi:hypothetical protein